MINFIRCLYLIFFIICYNLLSIQVMAQNEVRVALLIGNGDYQNMSRLKKPTNDVKDIGDMLKKYDFKVTYPIDLTKEQMEKAVNEFVASLQRYKQKKQHVTALFYYSGHGIQVNNTNYLIPIEATEYLDESNLGSNTLSLQEQISKISKVSHLQIIMVDACRVMPVSNEKGGGLPKVTLEKFIANKVASPFKKKLGGLYISFATTPNKIAIDGESEDRNSPYAKAVIESIETLKNEDLIVILQKISLKVNEYTAISKKNNTMGEPQKVENQYKDEPSNFYFSNSKSPDIIHPEPLPTPEPKPDLPVFVYEMVLVKGGAYQMGYDPNRDGDSKDMQASKPLHTEQVADFYIGKYEVTQEQWQTIMEDNPSNNKDCKTCPVEQVSYDDIKYFIEKLNAKFPPLGGKGLYRLPTEAEWEYAARGGNKSKSYKYAGANNIEIVGWSSESANNTTHPIGEKEANELGIYDMTGNVAEWTSSEWSEQYKKPNYTGTKYAIRGGAYIHFYLYNQIAYRDKRMPNKWESYIGFRLAYSIVK